VRYVVDGSVVQERDRVRLSATLIDAATNAPVWTERFERERRDVLALQRELAIAIARAVEVALTPQDRARLAEAPTVDPEAFELYIKGTQIRYRTNDPQDVAKAVNYFTGAIGQDSTYAPAYAGLAFIYALNGDKGRARQFADKALMLDPTLAEAHMVLGMVRHFSDWDWAGAEAAFREAIRLNPGYAEAHHELSMLLMRRQRFDEALREAQRALYLAPMSARFELGPAEVYLSTGRYNEALEAADKALAVDSINGGIYLLRAYVYGEQQRYDQAVEAAKKCIALGWDVHGRAILGYYYAKSNRRMEALKLVDTLTAKWQARNGEPGLSDVAISIAQIYAGLGDPGRALDWLERAVGTDMYVAYLGIDPTFRSLHAEPRFRTLLKAVGLEK
jgi:tetratricopeptide (TPR) repeat protein